MNRTRVRWARQALAALVLLFSAGVPVAAQTVDPLARYSTHRTAHFTIHFQRGADQVASDVAGIAEETWARVAARPGVTPPAMTHVVLADQSDSANGFAGPVPRNRIFLYLAAPTGTDRLNPTDWLRTLFVHEFTHIVHLDRSEGWARAARRVFGRAPWAFPNATLPTWQVEGLATWTESRDAGVGRLHAGEFLAVAAEAARAGTLEPMDRVNGGLTDWPGGLGAYAYGLGFHDYLARRFGERTFDLLARETAGSLPYFGTLRFKRVYGASLAELWRAYEREAADLASTAAVHVPDGATRVTRHGFVVAGPRFLSGGCDECTGQIAYSVRTPFERGTIRRVNPATGHTTAVTTRVSGSTTSVMPDGRLVFDEQEIRRNVSAYGDLISVDLRSGRRTRLTTAARLADADVSPDGTRLVAVQQRVAGQRDLVIVNLASIAPDATVATRVVASAAATAYSAPRWSPDGMRIVVSEQTGAAASQIVVVDPAADHPTKIVVTSTPGVRWVTPVWRHDGLAIVAAGALGDNPHQLYELPLNGGSARQLTRVSGGATWPDLSADGRQLAFVAGTAGGSDIYVQPYDPSAVPLPTAPPSASGGTPALLPGGTPPAIDAVPYRPWATLLPTSWSPLLSSADGSVRIGAGVGGADVLGYHAYAAAALWAVEPPPAGAASYDRTIPDWTVSYLYRRWRAQVFAAASRATTFASGSTDEGGDASWPIHVERITQAGVQLPLRRMRHSQAAQLSIVHAVDERRLPGGNRERNRSGARVSWRFSSAQRPGYAISPERGITLGLAGEFVTPGFGASGTGQTLTVDGRVYAAGIGRNHVLAVRVASGTTWGDDQVRRLFVLGGSDTNAVAGTLDSDGMSLLRGFGTAAFDGTHVAVLNVDYRFPLARPQRGIGAWPFLLHTIHASAFFDAGHAWFRTFATRDVKTSVGAEISADVVLGYVLPVTVTAGAAHGRDGSGAMASGVRAYARIGYAF